jgi:ABC-2 type transport system permease protein
MSFKNSGLAVYTLWERELVRFYRQPSRVIGALGTPLIFWLLIGSGFGTSFRAGSAAENQNYLVYFFPGTILLILLFTTIFSTFSLIQDRQEGFLQSVLVAPVPRSAIVLGKILGGTTLAFVQSFLFLLAAPWIGISLHASIWLTAAGVIFLNAFALTTLGFLIAWKVNSVQGFHAVMNLFLMPLWFLSGALFPSEGAPGWVRGIMAANPLTYGLAALRRVLHGENAGLTGLPSMTFSIYLVVLFSILLFVFATWQASERKASIIT